MASRLRDTLLVIGRSEHARCCPSWLARIRGMVAGCLPASALPDLDLPQRIIHYLTKVELAERDAWLRDDIRIARLTVFYAACGNRDPWRFAFWWYLGRTPERLIPEFITRAVAHAAMESGPLAVASEDLKLQSHRGGSGALPIKYAPQPAARRKAA